VRIEAWREQVKTLWDEARDIHVHYKLWRSTVDAISEQTQPGRQDDRANERGVKNPNRLDDRGRGRQSVLTLPCQPP